MALTNKQIEFFENNGYLVCDDIVDINRIREFHHVALKLLSYYCQSSELNIKINSDDNVSAIDQYLLTIHNKKPQLMRQIQRIISRMPEFCTINHHPKLYNAIKCLLNETEDCPLYLMSNCVVFDFPIKHDVDKSYDFHADWHDDLFWTIPESQFMHIWIQLLHNADASTGTLKVCPGSHKGDWHGRHQFHFDQPFNYRYSIVKEVVNRYQPIDVTVNLGQVLFFHSKLIHASGVNQSINKIRATMIGLYHNSCHPKFIAPTPTFKFVNKTPEQWFYEIYQDESILPLLDEQLDKSDLPPGGI